MTTIPVEFPDELLAWLRRSPEEVAADLRLAVAADWFRRGMVSQGRAAEIAKLSRADFIDAMAARQIEPTQANWDRLEDEISGA